MRKRKIIVVVLLVMLLGGASVFFLSRDSGTPVQVSGDFSAKDVAQIKSAVRRSLWREAFPGFSMQTLKALPGAVKRAWKTHVARIEGSEHEATAWLAGPGIETNEQFGYMLTNEPDGWAIHGFRTVNTKVIP
jgi:hypothetical protein